MHAGDPELLGESPEVAALRTLASYAPPSYIRLLAHSEQLLAPIHLPLPAAVLFADISGFTKLTERLCSEGEVGVELLASTLNAYFGQVIDLVAQLGGEVVKFAGDGLIALWSAREDAAVAAGQAGRCALALQAALQGLPPVHGITMFMRIGVGIGATTLQQLGGHDGRWELLFSGPALTAASLACPRANPGEVVLAAAAWSLVAAQARGEALEQGCVRLRELASAPQPPVPALPPLPADSAPLLRACLPEAVLERLDAGQSGWLTELRRVTVLFVLLPELDAQAPAAELIREVQEVLHRYEGSINKLHVDEKGTMLLAVFGLPPLSHVDDAPRAVRAALACQGLLNRHGERCAIGVATGRAFCGTVGNELRREYTVLGDVVNLSARLMSAAASLGADHPILCDPASHEAAKASIDFGAARLLQLKGKAQLISAHTPLCEARSAELLATAELFRRPMIGRAAELGQLVASLRALVQGDSGLCLIEGAAGVGKSHLTAEILAQAQQAAVSTLYGSGDAIERSTAYFAWTRVFRQLFELPQELTHELTHGATADRAALAQRLRERLTQLAPEQAAHAELLGPVLRIALEEGREWTAAVSSRAHAEQRQSLLIEILVRLAKRAPLLLLIENAHWLDSASWALLLRVRREVPRLLMIVVSRPASAISEPAVQAEYQRLSADPEARLIQLAPLPVDDTRALLCDRLAATTLPQSLVEFIFEQTGGHPFFTEELAFALRDAGVLRVEGGVGRLTLTPAELRAQRFPTTMRDVVLSRIDRLRPPQHLLLKVASVVGRTFAHPIVDSVHPILADRPHLPRYLDELEQNELTARHIAVEPTYSFKHIIIQEVAYNTLTFAQRRQLHLAVAAWYEGREAGLSAASGRMAELRPLLAHHYSQAAEHPHATETELAKAVSALKRAGDQALHSGAPREALALFERALGLLKRLPESESRSRLELALRAPQAIALGAVRGYSSVETEQALLRCLAQCQQLQKLGEVPELLPTLFGLWTSNLLRGRIWQARDYAAQSSALVQAAPDSDAALAVELQQQSTCFFLGELAAAKHHAEVLLSRYRRERHQQLTYLYGVDLEVMCLYHLGHTWWMLGNYAQAAAVYERNIALARELGHPYSLCFALYGPLAFYQCHGQLEPISRHVELLAALAEQHGYGHVNLQSEYMRGWVLAKQGQPEAGLAAMQHTLALRRRSGAELSMIYLLMPVAELQLACGQLDAALDTVKSALTMMAENGERMFAAGVLRVQAEILIRKSRGSFVEYPIDAGPDDLLLRSLDIARSQRSGYLEMCSVMTLCRLWGAQGNEAEARCLLEQTLVLYSDMMPKDELEAAQTLLKELCP